MVGAIAPAEPRAQVLERLDPNDPILIVPENDEPFVTYERPERDGERVRRQPQSEPLDQPNTRRRRDAGSAGRRIISGGAGVQGVESAPLAPLEGGQADNFGRAGSRSRDTDLPASQSQSPRSGDGGWAPETTVLAEGGFGPNLWRGLSTKEIERLLGEADFSVASPTLQALWRRALLTDAQPGEPGRGQASFDALRLEVLFRLGRVDDVVALTAKRGGDDAFFRAIRARALLAAGEPKKACGLAKGILQARARLPRILQRDIYLIVAHCAASTVNAKAGALIADLARNEGLEAPYPFAIIDALASSVRANPRAPKSFGLVEGLFHELAGRPWQARQLATVSPPLAVFLSRMADDPGVRLLAAERAARLAAINATVLGRSYHGASEVTRVGRAASLRARHFQSGDRARDPARKMQSFARLLEASRRDGLESVVAGLTAASLKSVRPNPSGARFGQSALEILVRAGEPALAGQWARAFLDRTGGRPNELPWLVLLDVRATRGRSDSRAALGVAEGLALRGRLSPPLMHRLVTVLDALDYNVPIPLWNAASQTPQPTDGYLPATGILSDLKIAAKRRDIGRGILLTMLALGPDGPAGANLIALADVVRALKAMGLEREARGVAFEALVKAWPNRSDG